jgi:CRISPR-associated protein (TIGR03985 family)
MGNCTTRHRKDFAADIFVANCKQSFIYFILLEEACSKQQCYQQLSLPSPDNIELEMSKAWGFDFYLPSTLMLLRFDRDFSDRYIKDTERHDTFEEISYQQAERLIEHYITQSRQKHNLPDVLTNCSLDDAYYQVFIRYQDSKHKDNKVIMRLRAWRPMCEVLLPVDLRQSIAQDVAAEYQLYHTLAKSL